MRLAGAPISWGVCEVPGWGLQLSPERVLDDMASLGLEATEAGPPGFLPADASAANRLLGARGLRLIGGFVTAVLHDALRRAAELENLERQARWLAAGGSRYLVLAPATGRADYSASAEIGDAGWRELFASLDEVERMASRRGLDMVVHPHWGTVIERRHDIERFLEGCGHGLCLDTGHIALGGADPVDIAEAAGARVRHVHLKDVDGDLAARLRDGAIDYAAAVRGGLYRALGDGAARIADVLALLRSRGYGGWHVLEQDVMLDTGPAGVPPWIERSAAFAKAHG